MKKVFFYMVAALLISACSESEPPAPAAPAAAPAPAAEAPAAMEEKPAEPTEASYKELHAQAVEVLDKAESVGGEWRDSRWKKAKAVKCGDKKMSYLHAAECFAEQGDYKNATKHAEIAKFQGERGYEQAMGQKDAAPRF